MTARFLGLVAAVAAVVLLVVVFHPPSWPWDQKLHLSLQARPFGALHPDASVELGGVKVGQVDGMDMVGGSALIRIEVESKYAGLLHADTSAMIRPHGLLGAKYIDLKGGSHGRLLDGDVVPSSRVSVATDIDQVLSSLQPDVRQNLQTLIVALGTGMDGRGQDVNDALQALGQASNNLSTVTGTLHTHEGDIQSIIGSAEQLSGDMQYAPVDAQLRDTNTVLSGLSEVRQPLGQGVDNTARVLQELDLILGGNTGALAYTLDNGPQTIIRLRALLVEATTLVKGVNPALPALMTAIVETKSAFGGNDANGNYVRIQAVLGSCLAGININCAGGPFAGGPAVTVPGATASAPASQASATQAAVPPSKLSDQDLMKLLLGNG